MIKFSETNQPGNLFFFFFWDLFVFKLPAKNKIPHFVDNMQNVEISLNTAGM